MICPQRCTSSWESFRRLHRQETEWFRGSSSSNHPREGKEATPALPQVGDDCRDSRRRGNNETLSPRAGRGCSSSLLAQAAGSSVPPLHLAWDTVKGVRISKMTHLQAQISSLHANPPAHALGKQATAFIFCPLGCQISPSPRIKHAAQPGTGDHSSTKS